MRRIATTVAAAAIMATALPASAGAAARWSLRGAGWGHGIGMSQYGAYGFAKHGADYREILAHYYRGTAIANRDGGTVRVLIEPNESAVRFRTAASAGDRSLNPDSVYRATRSGSTVVLRSSTGRVLKRVPDVLTVTGGPRVQLLGQGSNGVRDGIYRGSFEIRVARGPGLNAINAVDLESYVRGVVPNESPSSWPQAALQAQALAARTYALATDVGGRGFQQYADTRSQMYRGFLSETPSTAAAVSSTRGQIVTYNGRAVVTYFFSTSGGFTEDVENVFTGTSPQPWLQGVDDPYDNSSPFHRWGPFTYSTRAFAAKLGGWVRGRFRGIKVLQRGVSPRIVRAEVRGSRGNVQVTGPDLRARLGLRDTWFYLRRVTSATSAGLRARTASGSRPLVAIRGTVDSRSERFVTLQRKTGKKWAKVIDVPLERSGDQSSYVIHVGEPGLYRVLAGWAPGPALRVRF